MPHDLVCFSHLRWDFVFQRPHHLMVRAARDRRVLFIEEPTLGAELTLSRTQRQGVTVLTPRLPESCSRPQAERALRDMIHQAVRSEELERPVRWYWTPMD